MGMYTEIYVNVDLREDIPDEVIVTLKAMCESNTEHSLLKDMPQRWAYLFTNGSFYTPNTSCALLTFCEISKQYSLLAKGDIKNYQKEIEQFFGWLMPYIDAEEGEFIGYHRYEESRIPELVLKK